MKKLFSLMLVLSMACLMLFATAEGMEILGEWHLTVANFDGSDINPMDIGIKGVYCFFEDSTFIFSAEVAGQKYSYSGTWNLIGTSLFISFKGDTPFIAQYKNDSIIIESEGETDIYTRKNPESSKMSPRIVAAENEDVFLGNWESYAMEINGTYIANDLSESAGVDYIEMSLLIKPGKVILNTIVDDLITVELDSVFQNGRLVLYYDGEEDSFIELMEDGALLYAFDDEMNVYLTRNASSAGT